MIISMEGLRVGIARTEVFRFYPFNFEEAVDITFNAEFNFREARYGTYGHAQNSFDRAEPMDLSQADDEETQLQAVEQQGNIRRCYMSRSIRHLRLSFTQRKPRQNRPSRNTEPNQNPCMSRITSTPSSFPYGDDLVSVEAPGGNVEEGLSSNDFVETSTKCEYKSDLLIVSATSHHSAYLYVSDRRLIT